MTPGQIVAWVVLGLFLVAAVVYFACDRDTWS